MQTFLLFLIQIFFFFKAKRRRRREEKKEEKVFVSEMKKIVDTNFIHIMRITQKKFVITIFEYIKIYQ